MFHSKVIIVLIIVTNVLTNPVVNPPARCCFPSRYSFKTSYFSSYSLPEGMTSTTVMQSDYAYDAEKGFWAIRGTQTFGSSDHETSFWTIHDFKNEVLYGIDPARNICVKSSNIPAQKNCILEAAMYVNSSMDSYNGKDLLVDTWVVTANEYTTYEKVTRDSCIQLGSSGSSKDTGTTSTSTVSDYVENIVDPTIFEIPSSCY